MKSKGKQGHAIDRAKLARNAKPLGELITGTAAARRSGVPPVPIVHGNSKRVEDRGRTDKRKRSSGREAQVLHDCLKSLHSLEVFAWRNNTGTLWTNGQPVSFGYPGSPDIIGVLPNGRFLGVECKSATGRQSAKQKKFEAKLGTNKGLYILARSADEMLRRLKPCLPES